MNKLLTKLLRVPENNETKVVEAVQLWYVSWYSRNGKFSGDTNKEVEAFASRKDAEEFAKALRAAFTLLRITGEATGVSLTGKNK